MTRSARETTAGPCSFVRYPIDCSATKGTAGSRSQPTGGDHERRRGRAGRGRADFNGDGRFDFYVANDGTANQLWINQGQGHVMDAALLAGVAFNRDGVPEGSMGLAVGDPDDDGDLTWW